MDEFEYYSDGEFNRVSKYVPINGINTNFMYGYLGPHDPIKDIECEEMVNQAIKEKNG